MLQHQQLSDSAYACLQDQLFAQQLVAKFIWQYLSCLFKLNNQRLELVKGVDIQFVIIKEFSQRNPLVKFVLIVNWLFNHPRNIKNFSPNNRIRTTTAAIIKISPKVSLTLKNFL